MRFSHLHSSEVPLVLNLSTGSITPHYHIVFDDHFSSVTSVERVMDPPDHWADVCLENTTYIPVDSTSDSTLESCATTSPMSVPVLDDWTVVDRAAVGEDFIARALQLQDAIRSTYKHENLPSVSTTGMLQSSVCSLPSTLSVSGVELSAVPPVSTTVLPVVIQHGTVVVDDEPPPLLPRAQNPQKIEATTLRRSLRANKGVFRQTRYIDKAYHSGYNSSTLDPDSHDAQLAYMADLLTCSDTGVINITDPRLYAVKASRTNSDMPTFQQAINGPEASEYIKAMKIEVQTLVDQRTWESVPRLKHQKVLKGTWVFKLKPLTDGTAYRYKARFCARGDMQTEGVDFFETFAPVVQWSTIRLLLSTVLTEGWTTRQVDYTNTFAQAELKEELFVEYPRLFGPKSGADRVLCLLKSLYGLRQAPRTFFDKLKAGLEE